MLDWCASQVDYLGGRILPPDGIHAHWRVQAFFEDPEPTDDPWRWVRPRWLPDGCRRVIVPPTLAQKLFSARATQIATAR